MAAGYPRSNDPPSRAGRCPLPRLDTLVGLGRRHDVHAERVTLTDAVGLWEQACCLTLVRAVGVHETFRRLDADLAASTTTGFADLVRRAYEQGSDVFDRQVVGAAEVHGWTLVLEPNGYACGSRVLMRRLSRGTTAVSLYQSDGLEELSVHRDGRRRRRLDLGLRGSGQGIRHGLPEQPISTGTLGPAGPLGDVAGSACVPWPDAGSVLVERFTGVRLSTDLIVGLRYRTGLLASC